MEFYPFTWLFLSLIRERKNFNSDLPTEVTLELMWLKTKGTYCLSFRGGTFFAEVGTY